ncbi:putative adhesin [Clostridium sp. DJ247]|uniref:putative adhesin n=1 Tax=Clostridium sp. DJ247 TaxID=2726188 RepID=UPI001626BC6F|nr:hypothetical protein [Clostridium sp. DJ247]MBC2579578.1 hypothetical protein [Clostridium sp. DJ247]
MGKYIVSAHGGRDKTSTLVIPDGFQVNFFVNDNQTLEDKEAWSIYNHLLAGDTNWADYRSKLVHHVGERIYDYFCWYYPEISDNSGVIKVGAITPVKPVISLKNYTQQSPLKLSTIFEMLKSDPGIIYWVACTNIL